MKFKNYYTLLGVKKTSTSTEIKNAFRKLARKHHPDLNPNDKKAESKFKEVNEAYEVLSDPGKRKKYDELGANWKHYEQATDANPFGRGNPNNFNWRFDFSKRTGENFYSTSENTVNSNNPFSDFFQTFFGERELGHQAQTRSNYQRARQGRTEHKIQLSLEQAFCGFNQRLSINAGGQSQSIEVRIPAGVTNGSRIRVKGKGKHGDSKFPGDLFLLIKLMPHKKFKLKGKNLHIDTHISVTTAVLGGEIQIPTLDGKPIRLKIPTLTQSGQSFRLRGKGMPSVGDKSSQGDLYATVKVELPKHLSPTARKHYEELAELENTASTKKPTSSVE